MKTCFRLVFFRPSPRNLPIYLCFPVNRKIQKYLFSIPLSASFFHTTYMVQNGMSALRWGKGNVTQKVHCLTRVGTQWHPTDCSSWHVGVWLCVFLKLSSASIICKATGFYNNTCRSGGLAFSRMKQVRHTNIVLQSTNYSNNIYWSRIISDRNQLCIITCNTLNIYL